MHHLSIDLETFSSVPINKAGAWRYIDSPDFEILLFAYSVDGGQVQCVDMASGEQPPPWLISALFDPDYIKHAYNAAFEFGCLSKVYGQQIPAQWRDTMLHGLYCGYTAGLGITGAALGLPEDKRKLATGKALIRYFCVPCKPSKTNGGRTRNYYYHDPDKWTLFKEYNLQDVVTEMEIDRRLSNVPVPDAVQKQWETDLRINQRGVAVDMQLVEGALSIAQTVHDRFVAEAQSISGLNNPNSVAQLTAWLNEQDDSIGVDNLRKDTVNTLLSREGNSASVARMLEIRQELGKTSTKKYNALEMCVCSDGRVRGLLQFYGANRTGRWAGRLVQVQNLPRTYISLLDPARNLVKQRSADGLGMIFGSVPDTLSQLIRTAFIATPGNVLIDADFSAIEARVISWLAGEEWRLDVFRTHGKIYEASASQMFGVPVEKHGINGHLRQKGKIAELALGYGGAVGALKAMGALDMGLSEEELPPLVQAWRNANPNIVNLWWAVDSAVTEAVQRRTSAETHGIRFTYRSGMLLITLPSGRNLTYIKPKIGTNSFGSPCVTYEGIGGTKKWERLESYGPKFVENIVQATARDILCYAMKTLRHADIVMHIHDEIVIEADPQMSLQAVCGQMGRTPPWAPGLLLRADGYETQFYRKD